MKGLEGILSVILLICLFASSLIYMLVDFSSDVNPSTWLYAFIQLVFAVLLLIDTIIYRFKPSSRLVVYIGRFLCLVLAVVQVLPTILWLLFNGSTISETPGEGIMAHWGYAVAHMIIVALCVFNMTMIKRSRRYMFVK
ncbi:hypothetical protein DFR58_12614 [Anaerobacterium chartisolvens]|uniref:Uncharacterized protein n=1 Tax=Anaerobacterium chartisolvens TaxID=1297424 RepID=A0A369APY8_9FIRM|nr:hypothetical protein [Anaerobacterium chartisolvens]RCX11241.1 hypothetical protein DFR58_12614 [Anaerobacterium chartisolvens]